MRDQTCPMCGGEWGQPQVIPHLQSTYCGPLKLCDDPFHSTGRVPATEPPVAEDAAQKAWNGYTEPTWHDIGSNPFNRIKVAFKAGYRSATADAQAELARLREELAAAVRKAE